jgi:hypothetical protein
MAVLLIGVDDPEDMAHGENKTVHLCDPWDRYVNEPLLTGHPMRSVARSSIWDQRRSLGSTPCTSSVSRDSGAASLTPQMIPFSGKLFG